MTQRSPCPVGKVVKLLGDSCSILIVRDLLESPKRFGDLADSLSASSRTLTKKLKQLEKERMIERKETRGKPNIVQYRLTRKGAAFHGVVEAMRKYGRRYL